MSVLWIKDFYKQGNSSHTVVVTPNRLDEGHFKTITYEKYLPKKLSNDTLLLVRENGNLYVGTGTGIKKITGQIKVDSGDGKPMDLSEYLKIREADEKYATKDELSHIQNNTPGKSAYEIAKENGFSGASEQEWLASLRGKDGNQGSVGPQGINGKSAYEIAQEEGYIGSKEDWIASLKGANGTPGRDGESAYQIAQRINSFVGSEAEWLASLKGEKGDNGNSENHDTEHNVVFHGSDVNIVYPYQGKIQSVIVIMSEGVATEISLPLVKMDAASFAAGSNAWEIIDDKIKMPAMTRYKTFENLTQNIDIKKGDILRIGSVENDNGLYVTIKIKQER